MNYVSIGGLTPGDDTIRITQGGPEGLLRFVVDARGGDDLIVVATVHEGGSADQIWARGGDDTVYAGANNDLVYGGSGADFIHGGSGDDRLFGGLGNDDLRSGTGVDELFGGEGDDVLVAGGEFAMLDGGAGSDSFIVRAGVEVVRIVDLDLDFGGIDLALDGADTLLIEGSESWSGRLADPIPDDGRVDAVDELTSRLAEFAEFGRVAAVQTGVAGDTDEEIWILLNDGENDSSRLIRLEGWAARLEAQPHTDAQVAIPGTGFRFEIEGDADAVLERWVDAGVLKQDQLDSWIAKGFLEA